MASVNLPILQPPLAPPARAWVPNPFLHIGPDRLYNPLTDLTLLDTEPGFALVRGVQEGRVGAPQQAGAEVLKLAEAGWLTQDPDGLASRYRLKFVSLEAHTVCNQACYFCPVSVAPREAYFMPMETYHRILGELAALAEPIEAVFMISYNEPTADSRFVEQVRAIRQAGLQPATLTNGSGLTPKRVDEMLELGGLRFLSINISTLDRERYRQDRGHDHLPLVLRNLDYVKDKPLAPDMDIVVLGTGDQNHQDDFAALQQRFEGSLFNVKSFIVNDRAGYLQIGLSAQEPDKSLCGCDYMGSRPLQHLHITPKGKCILCCQDYHETWEVGDLNTHSVREVLEGPAFIQARRWVYGLDPAPANFLCNGCRYALKR
jgi:hypothetical protein